MQRRTSTSRLITDFETEVKMLQRAEMRAMQRNAREKNEREVNEFLATNPSEEDKKLVLQDKEINHLALTNYLLELGKKDEKVLVRAVDMAEAFFQSGKMISDEKVLELGRKLSDVYKKQLNLGQLHEVRGKALGTLSLNGFFTIPERDKVFESFMSNNGSCFSPSSP